LFYPNATAAGDYYYAWGAEFEDITEYLTVGGSTAPSYGTNANGEYEQDAAGVIRCWAQIELVYASSTFLTGTWTFPKSFTAAPRVQVAYVNAVGTIAGTSVIQVYTSSIGLTTVTIALHGSGYAAADTAYVDLSAIGR
jgi:hypothetical protein